MDDVVFFGFIIEKFDFICDVGGLSNNSRQVMPKGLHRGTDVVTNDNDMSWFVGLECLFLVVLIDTGSLCFP